MLAKRAAYDAAQGAPKPEPSPARARAMAKQAAGQHTVNKPAAAHTRPGSPRDRSRAAESLWEQRRIEREAAAHGDALGRKGSGRVYLDELHKLTGGDRETFTKAVHRLQKRGGAALYRLDHPKEASAHGSYPTPSGEDRHVGYFGGRSGGLPPTSRKASGPSLKDQAAAKRSTKGTRADRLAELVNRQSGYANNSTRKIQAGPDRSPLFGGKAEPAPSGKAAAASGKAIATRDHKLNRKARLQSALDALKPKPAEAAFSLGGRRSSSSSLFSSSGGKTSALFDDMRGAASRDLPGQATMFGAKPAKASGRGTDARKDKAAALLIERARLRAGADLGALTGADKLRAAMGGSKARQDAIIRRARLQGSHAAETSEGVSPKDSAVAARVKAAAAHIEDSGGRYHYLGATDKAPKIPARGTGRKATAGTPGKAELARLRRRLPPVSGGSPMAILQHAQHQQESRDKRASVIRKQRERLAKLRRDPATHTEHEPGHVGQLETQHIHFDPERFQYKLAAQGAHGVTDALHGVKKWDPNLGGVLQVWKDPANGKTYVVNGHHRLDLANKLGAGKVAVRFIGAKDAEEARGIGALTNIAEGRGTSLDAAKFFRETGHGREDLERKGIPMKEKTATEGLALANLHEPIFKRVVNGELTPARGSIIGDGLSHAQQKAIVANLDKMPKGRAPSDATLREAVEHAKHAPTTTTTTRGLFGDDVDETSLALHRAEAASHVRERLGREKKVFGTVSKARNAEDLGRAGNVINAEESGKVSAAAGQNLATFDLLKHRSGPVSKLLNEAAERVHRGEKKKAVRDEIYRRLPAAVQEALSGG
jgi:hypothetical protein